MADAVSVADSVPQVLFEIQSGDGRCLAAAVREFPAHRGPGTVNPSTGFRWVTKGVKTKDGRVVRLEAVRVGGRWLTSRGAVARFVSALTAAANPATTEPAPPLRKSAARRRAADRAARELERRGA